MEENKQNKMLKNKILTGIICGVIIIIVSVSLCFMYNYIVRKNNVAELTSSDLTKNNYEEQIYINEDIENIENIDPIQEKDEEIIEELEEVEEQEKLEEDKKMQEELKKQEQEKKKAEEAKKKQQAKEQKKNQIAQTSNYKYYLKVNYTANTVTAYSKDQNGNYTIPVRAMICSTGRATPTSGVYRTMNKYRWRLLIGNSYGQYSTRITGQILFHSVPYERQSEDSLITVYYDRLGITTSLGCIRLTVADAKWIYDNCPLGTCVEFYSSSNPGPLGKPTAKKITSYGAPLNRWDPTDPNINNPWRTYNANNSTNKNNTVNNTTNSTNKNNTVNNTTNSTNKNNTVNNTTNSTNKNNTVNNTTNSTNKNNTVNNTTNSTNKNNTVNNTTNSTNKNNTVNNTTNSTNKNNTVNNTTNSTNKNNTVNNTTTNTTNKNNTVNKTVTNSSKQNTNNM